MERLDRAGYEQYEISNVARPGRESRHNLKYWTDGEWLGFGCGAHSTRKACGRRMSPPQPSTFRSSPPGDSSAWSAGSCPARTRLEEALFMGLRLTSGLDLAAIESRYRTDVWAAVR